MTSPLEEYVEEYAAALARQFAHELEAVDWHAKSARADTDATVHVVEATADRLALDEAALRGLDVAVREFAAQHGFEVVREGGQTAVEYEFYPSPAIDWPSAVPA